jgi:DNA-binding Lrp family transcriptional regulator
MPPFSFLTNHGLALLCIAEDPHARMRDIAAAVGITERAAQRIVSDLVGAGYLDRERDGRRNSYTVRLDLPVKLSDQRDVELGALMRVLAPAPASGERSVRAAGTA